MTGRHRRTRAATARRALVAGVPALGLVGAVTAVTGAEFDAAPSADASGSVGPVTDTAVPLAPAATARPAVTTAASDAALAADRAGEHQREQERRALVDVVSDVRADAQAREAAAAAQGQEQLDAFRSDVARQQQPEPGPSTRADPAPTDLETDRETDEGAGRCDTSGTPMLGDRADPDEIVGRDCGLVDTFGRERSFDPWIDGQLLSGLGR